MKNDCFLNAVKCRRSVYALGKNVEISQEQICEMISCSLKYAPTAFNSQSARIVLLLGYDYVLFWNNVKQKLAEIVSSEKFAATEAKINSFAQGIGTVLFFEDDSVIHDLEQKYPLYKENFYKWSLQSNGMLQYIVWTTLEEAGLGASLQHYNPLIDEMVAQTWDIPSTWKLLAQMPFGSVETVPEEKTFLPLAPRLKIYNKV